MDCSCRFSFFSIDQSGFARKQKLPDLANPSRGSVTSFADGANRDSDELEQIAAILQFWNIFDSHLL